MTASKPRNPILNPSHLLARGLVTAWIVQNNSKVELRDYSGRGLHATIGGAVTQTVDKYGPALSFTNVSNSFAQYASHPDPILPITFAFRFKPAATNPRGIFDSAPNVPNVLRNYNTGQIEWQSSNPVVSFTLPTANEWYDMAAVFYYNGNRQVEVYVDGRLNNSGTGNTSASFTWTNFRLGDINAGTAGRYVGLLDHFYIFSGTRWGVNEAASHHRDAYAAFRPLPQTHLVITTASAGANSITITWNSNAQDITLFSIERSTISDKTGFTEIDTVAAGTYTYEDTSVSAGVPYWYRVLSYDGVRYSDPSNVFEITLS